MKMLRKLSFIGLIILMGLFIIKNLNKETETEASSNGYYTVEALNGNSNAGNLVVALVTETNDGQTTVETLSNPSSKINVLYGKKVRVYFLNGLNDGYSISLWASTNYSTYSVVKDSTDNSKNYTNDYIQFTVTQDIGVYCAALKETDHLVTFYETAMISKASIIGYSVVSDGSNVSLDYVFVPSRKGFDFTKFSESLLNIKEDITVYPMYDSNIFTIFRDYWKMFLKGLGITLILAVIAIFLSLFFGLALCLLRISENKVLRIIGSVYIEIIRGVPSLLLLLVIYCLIGPTGISLGSFFSTEIISCILALFLNSAAYTAEIYRSGIQAVEIGQTEAGYALGLSKWQVLRKIVLPQGLKNSLPSLGNELVMIIKETSLAYSVNTAIGELMSAKVTITSVTGDSLSPYFIIAIIYFIVTFSLSRFILYMEKRMSA